MAQWLKQSTAATVPIGPFVDDTDFKTAETALTISQADIRLSKNGGAFAQSNNVAGATHLENGVYGVPLDTTDTNTLGRLRVEVHEAGALAVWQDFMIVPANVWDSMFGADNLQVDTIQVGGTAQTAGDIIGDTNDIQARLPAALVGGRMDASVGAMAAGVVTAAAIATGAVDADAIAADAVTEIQAGLSTLTAAQVNAEVVDALNVDTYAEPGQATPPATTSLASKIGYNYKFLRNRITVTGTTISVYNDDATTVGQKSTHSDDGTTYDRGEFTTGP